MGMGTGDWECRLVSVVFIDFHLFSVIFCCGPFYSNMFLDLLLTYMYFPFSSDICSVFFPQFPLTAGTSAIVSANIHENCTVKSV